MSGRRKLRLVMITESISRGSESGREVLLVRLEKGAARAVRLVTAISDGPVQCVIVTW